MMEKVIEAGSWDGPGMEQPVHRIKVSSRGLVGEDRREFLKVASHVFADAIDNIKLADGDIPIHLTAIGATEAYGPNRNGDGFNEATCRSYHDSFVKNARYYRNHKNKEPDKSYGIVKLSAYNQPMRRIELLLLGNGNEKAAARNNGLVMKQSTINKLDNDESVPFSMACKIAYDECDNCHNKAANRTQYCTEDTCISDTGRRMFGCRDGLTKVAHDGQQQFVENPNPLFFDMSEVARPADRIAFGGTADYMQKAAALDHTPGGAELAEIWTQQFGATFDLLSPEATIFRRDIADQVKLARDLAEVERVFESNQTEQDLAFARALSPATQSSLDVTKLGSIGSNNLATGLSALAGQKIALPLQDFLHLVLGDDDEKVASFSETVPRHLPGVFGRLVADGNLESALKANQFAPSRELAPRWQRDWASKQASAYSLSPRAVQNRVFHSAVQQGASPGFIGKAAMIKTAAADEASEDLARRYGLYKLAFLADLPVDRELSQIKRLAVCQNYVMNH